VGKILSQLAALMFLSQVALAKPFDYNKETFAAYCTGTYGPLAKGDSLISDSSGAGTHFDKKISSLMGAEIGVLYRRERVTLRGGVGFFVPQRYTALAGLDASNQTLFNLVHRVYTYSPQGSIELDFYHSQTARAYVGAGAGYAVLNGSSEYTFTPAGTTAYGVSDYKETFSGTAIQKYGYLGYEFLLSDHVTFSINGGYRDLTFTTLKASGSYATLTGAYTEGKPLVNNNGDNRRYVMSGFYTTIGLQFFISWL
jgi:hypothetical protein